MQRHPQQRQHRGEIPACVARSSRKASVEFDSVNSSDSRQISFEIAVKTREREVYGGSAICVSGLWPFRAQKNDTTSNPMTTGTDGKEKYLLVFAQRRILQCLRQRSSAEQNAANGPENGSEMIGRSIKSKRKAAFALAARSRRSGRRAVPRECLCRRGRSFARPEPAASS